MGRLNSQPQLLLAMSRWLQWVFADPKDSPEVNEI
jgi:hypothetical protein